MIVTTVIGSGLSISLGIVGQYIGRIYEQAKARPLYLVAATVNVDTDPGLAEPTQRAFTKAI